MTNSDPQHQAISEWIARYHESFEQAPEIEMNSFLRCWVDARGTYNGEEVGFIGLVIGYTKELIVHPDPENSERAVAFSFITDEGLAMKYVKGMEVKILDEEEVQAFKEEWGQAGQEDRPDTP